MEPDDTLWTLLLAVLGNHLYAQIAPILRKRFWRPRLDDAVVQWMMLRSRLREHGKSTPLIAMASARHTGTATLSSMSSKHPQLLITGPFLPGTEAMTMQPSRISDGYVMLYPGPR